MPVRFLETFMDPNDCSYLAKLHYFDCMLDLIAKNAPERDGAAIVMETRLSPRLESLCEQLIAPITKTSGKQRISLRETLEAFGNNPGADTVPAGVTSTYILGLLLGICEHTEGK
ncbi:unnamed protein product [Cylicostephanus goldi]|uniref:Uncharacterized protein n=1 Tax=Cylicostephanus goldi TaxID=71465 RepID=A0A3P7N6J5_CYLGO|nr:unnamed protein product [Cylicostephanus goldi]